VKIFALALSLVLLLLAGCAPLLQREYSTAEPHSSKFWESEAAGTLRAENYQDIVNDLLLLISQHTEAATLRLYNYADEVTVTSTVERATAEILQETPLGAYAVEYITSTSQAQKGYYEIAIQISYRRSAEQVQALVNATSPEAVYALLETALNENKTELAVRVGYWGVTGQEQVETAMAQLREDRGLTESKPWLVQYYPAEGPVGLLEFLLDPTEEQLAAMLPEEPETEQELSPEEEGAESSETEEAQEPETEPEKENEKN